MTEFFSNLVARSMERAVDVGEGAILRPRLPSLFEAPSGAGSVAVPRAGESVVLPSQEPAHGPTGEETGRRSSQRAEPFPPAVERKASTHRRQQAGWGDDPDASDEDERGDQPQGVPGSRRIAWDEHRLVQAEQAAEQVRPYPSEFIMSRRETTDLAGTLPQVAARMEKGFNGRQPGQAEAPDAGLTIHPRIDRYDGAQENPPMMSVDSSGAGTNNHPAAERYGQSAEENTAPTVHIRIGRIEVRAVTQPAPQPAPRPVRQQPKLGLDDYLRQRSEGKR